MTDREKLDKYIKESPKRVKKWSKSLQEAFKEAFQVFEKGKK
jgi:hypothetical protein